MTQSTKKYQALMIVLFFALSVLTSCGGGGGGGGGGGSTLPGVPTGLRVTVSSGRVDLSWNAAANAWRYNIYYSYTPGVPRSSTNKLSTTATSYPHLGLSNGATLYYIVTTLNSTGLESANSAEVSARLAAPYPPASFMAVASSGTGTPTVNLNWSAVSEAVTYNLYRDETPSVTTAIATGINGTSHADTSGLVNGSTYYYVVKSVNSFGTGTASLVSSATPTSGTTGNFTIRGTVTYEDKEYDRTVGLTGVTTFKAVRLAQVELVDASTAGTMVSSLTGTDGSYTFTRPSTDLGRTVYVRIVSTATPTGSQEVNVKTWGGAVHAVKTGNFTFSGNATVNLAIQATSTADGAFNILDVMTSGFQFINFHEGGASAMTLNTYWEYDVSNGTYFCDSLHATYCPGGLGIYVLSDPNGAGDTDEFDDDVLYHEFGHFTADRFSTDHSMGGPHYLNANDLDMRLTWSEGWGNFFQGAVKHWLSGTNPSLISSKPGMPLSQYVDTVIGTAAIIVDVADPDNLYGGSIYCDYYGTDDCIYSTNEIAVANVLWNHLTDTGSYGMQPIWEVVTGFKAVPPAVVNLEAFFDRWKTLYGDPDPVIYQNRLIYYSNDAFETDNAIVSAKTFTVNSGSQNRRLYASASWPADDADHVLFTASTGSTYTITASNMKNGADTYLTLYDNLGGEIITGSSTRDNTSGKTWIAGNGQECVSGANYDCYIYFTGVGWEWQEVPNNATNLASSITNWTPPSSGTYYLKISPSSARPKSAGRYGSYTLNITSP